LFLNCDKIQQELGWSPSWDFADTVRVSVDWYKRVHHGEDPLAVTAGQIADYSRAARGKLGFLQ
jgi:CDP-glucose 4,6-dehydratase